MAASNRQSSSSRGDDQGPRIERYAAQHLVLRDRRTGRFVGGRMMYARGDVLQLMLALFEGRELSP